MGDVLWQGVLDLMPQSDLDWIIGSCLVAVISSVLGPVLTALMSRRISKKVDETNSQVRNHHPDSPNLREDIDELKQSLNFVSNRIAPVTGSIRVIQADMSTMQKDVGGLRSDIRNDRKISAGRIQGLADRVRDLEQKESS